MKFKCDKYKRLSIVTDAGIIDFKNGEYETEDKKEIAILNKVLDVSVEEIEK